MPTALIIGAGRHVGRALIQKLIQEGWKISVGSMEPDYETATREGYLTFRAPLTQSDVLYAALGDAVMNLGAFPNVIVYNAIDFPSLTLPDPKDPLSLPLSTIQRSSEVGLHSVYVAVQFAVRGFSTLPPSDPQIFIVTGNPMPFVPAWDKMLTLGLAKAQQAYFMDHLATVFADRNFQFYFATQVKSATEPMGLEEYSAAAHATAYWTLMNRTRQGNWSAQFNKEGVFVNDL